MNFVRVTARSRIRAMPMPTGLPSGWTLHAETNPSTKEREWRIKDKAGKDKAVMKIKETTTPHVWAVAWSKTEANGYGAYLYEKAIEWCGAHGGHLTPDKLLSDEATAVWGKYHGRNDIEKLPHQREIRRYDPQKAEEDLNYNPLEQEPIRDEPHLQNKFRHKKYSTPEMEAEGRKRYRQKNGVDWATQPYKPKKKPVVHQIDEDETLRDMPSLRDKGLLG